MFSHVHFFRVANTAIHAGVLCHLVSVIVLSGWEVDTQYDLLHWDCLMVSIMSRVRMIDNVE